MNAILLNEQSRLMREMMIYAMKDSMSSSSFTLSCKVFYLNLSDVFLHCSYMNF